MHPCRRSRALALALSVLMASAAGGCGAWSDSSPSAEASATHTFLSPPAATLDATARALRTLGYKPAVVDAETGTIETARKHVYTHTHRFRFEDEVSIKITRQYLVHLEPVDRDHTRVVAERREFIGDRLINADNLWPFSAPETQPDPWARLFAEIESNL